MTKEIVATAIENLPDTFTLDDLFERLVFIEEVQKGLKDIEEGRTIPLEEVEKIIQGWRK
jgi:predicted transcriptional regulator